MTRVSVVDANGQPLSPCDAQKSENLVASGAADIISHDPLTIRLHYPVNIVVKKDAEPRLQAVGSLLLHICCGPCATYTSRHLRETGWEVTGFWYNPNIEPGDEYDRRLASMRLLAQATDLKMVWDISSSSAEFREAVGSDERFGERCLVCYRMRLRRTAQAAAERKIGTISTSLLISPYQNLEQLRVIGEEEAQACGVRFYYENMRRGYQERTRLALAYGLYLQRYCGCSFSALETGARRARKISSQQAG